MHINYYRQTTDWFERMMEALVCLDEAMHLQTSPPQPFVMPTSRSTLPEDLSLLFLNYLGIIIDTSSQSQEGAGDLLRMFSKTTSSLLKGQSFCDVKTTSADLWYCRPRSCSSCPGPLITEPSAMISPRCLCFLFLDLPVSCPILFFSFFWELLFPS